MMTQRNRCSGKRKKTPQLIQRSSSTIERRPDRRGTNANRKEKCNPNKQIKKRGDNAPLTPRPGRKIARTTQGNVPVCTMAAGWGAHSVIKGYDTHSYRHGLNARVTGTKSNLDRGKTVPVCPRGFTQLQKSDEGVGLGLALRVAERTR